MGIKSDFVIHWTGKDIQKNIKNLTDGDRDLYIRRLVDTCKKGLWMTPYGGELHGFGSTTLESFSVVTCFTENRKEFYLEHSKKYGLMGFGFNRKWILDRDGIPVIYLKNDDSDIHTSLLTKTIITLSKYSDDNNEVKLRDAYWDLSLVLDYTKPMSEKNKNDFEFLEESEWRICWHSHLSRNNRIVKNVNPTKPEYFIPFNATDLEILILPDEQCRTTALNNVDFFDFYKSGNYQTLILSLDEIEKI